MKVSFVIPVYKKKADQLRRAIKSLKEQSYKDIEIIVVFDGGDDQLEAILPSEFPELTWFTIDHGGASLARNAGIEKATGEFVAAWDADCYAEPDMVERWVEMFKKDPSLDFVYSGYRWSDPTLPGFESESLDPWTLSKYNYIASMFPIRREKCPKWDESLSGLQDWDFWRTAVENGCKGVFIPGFDFATDYPDRKSISGVDGDTFKKRVEAVRKKHGDADTDVLVHGVVFSRDTIRIAKLLGADYFKNPVWKVRNYKTILQIAFNPAEIAQSDEIFRSGSENAKRIIYWMGLDAEYLGSCPYTENRRMVKTIKEYVHENWCDDVRTKVMLDDFGLLAEVVPFPHEEGSVSLDLPTQFKVLVFADDHFAQITDSVIKAMPDIPFDMVVPDKNFNLSDYTCVIEFTRAARLTNSSKNVLMQGRYLISNIQEPYAGYVEHGDDPVKFKGEIIKKIRQIQKIDKPNTEAHEYYMDKTDPRKFKDRVLGTQLEVVS